MFPSPTWFSADRKRKDIRPLYRRIFTNRRLDFLHKFAVRSIFGFLLASTSYIAVTGSIYVKYIRPLKQEERERLERELIEADKAGFAIRIMRRMISRFFTVAAASYPGLFLVGVGGGAGFELFKVKFTFNGANYFTTVKKNQLRKELEEFERGLIELDKMIATGKPAAI
ncbi:hypothetical protein PMAYCL1PPCAC_12849 [Pristionchus mayeri]|uniref:Transmembrane protein n=1 Tax=Pristionchus mayeri TaxID=1317129 RepID=A0AAN4ZMK9_9BILA|nr:hypothetical protein PMAYCL1PPCAC_12849 [Pristionchus mayeri]